MFAEELGETSEVPAEDVGMNAGGGGSVAIGDRRVAHVANLPGAQP